MNKANQYPYSTGHYFKQDNAKAAADSMIAIAAAALAWLALDGIGVFIANLFIKQAVKKLEGGKKVSANATAILAVILSSWVPAGSAAIQAARDGSMLLLIYAVVTILALATCRKIAEKKLEAIEKRSRGSRKAEITEWREVFSSAFATAVVVRAVLGAMMAFAITKMI